MATSIQQLNQGVEAHLKGTGRVDTLAWAKAHAHAVVRVYMDVQQSVARAERPGRPSAEDSAPRDMTQAALAELEQMVQKLAALPPPSPAEKDDVGFAPQTDKALRGYLYSVQARGNDTFDLLTHLDAARLLLLHNNTQLGGRVGPVVRALEAAAKIGKADQVSEEDFAGVKRRTFFKKYGANLKERSKEWRRTVVVDKVRERAEGRAQGSKAPVKLTGATRYSLPANIDKPELVSRINVEVDAKKCVLWLNPQPWDVHKALKKDGFDAALTLGKGGWGTQIRISTDAFNKLRVYDKWPMSNPGFAALFSASADMWLASCGKIASAKPGAPAKPTAAPVNDAKAGTIALDTPLRDWPPKLQWRWDGGANVDWSAPLFVPRTGRKGPYKMPVASSVAQDAGYPARLMEQVNGRRIYWQPIPLSRVRAFFDKMEEMLREEDTAYAKGDANGLATAARQLQPMFKAWSDAADVQRGKTVSLDGKAGKPSTSGGKLGTFAWSKEDVLEGLNAIRAHRNTLGVDADKLSEANVAEIGQIAENVKPGAQEYKIDGRRWWRVEDRKGKPTIVVASPSLPSLSGYNMPAALRRIRAVAKQERRTGLITLHVPLAKALKLAHFLDDFDLPLAFSIRLGLLTQMHSDACADAVHLSSAATVAAIADPKLRARVVKLLSGLKLTGRLQTPRGPITIKPDEAQKVGIAFLDVNGGRGLIADSMGVGKTLQAVGWMKLRKDSGPKPGDPPSTPAVIICPGNAIGAWYSHFKMLWPELPVGRLLERPGRASADGTGEAHEITVAAKKLLRQRKGVVILAYANVASWLDYLLKYGPNTVVLDEAHRVKVRWRSRHKIAKQTEATRALADTAPYVIETTGTPIENEAAEIWHLLRLIDPEEFGKASSDKKVKEPKNAIGFGKFYEAYGKDGTFDVNGAGFEGLDGADGAGDAEEAKLERLRGLLACYMVRRTKADAGIKLPPKFRLQTWLPLTKSDETTYKTLEKKMTNYIASRIRTRLAQAALRRIIGGADPIKMLAAAGRYEASVEDQNRYKLAGFNYMRQGIAEIKVPHVISWIRTFLRDKKKPLIVFMEHKKVLQAVVKALKKTSVKFAVIAGSTLTRDRVIEDFQEGKLQVVLGTRSAREGITLTRAHHVAMLELWWIPAWMEQAEDRAYRRGQTDPVFVHYLLGRLPSKADTVESWMLEEIIQPKMRVTEALLNVEDVKSKKDIDEESLDVVEGDTAAEKAMDEKRALDEMVKASNAAIGRRIESAVLRGKDTQPTRADLIELAQQLGSTARGFRWLGGARPPQLRGKVQTAIARQVQLGGGSYVLADAVKEALKRDELPPPAIEALISAGLIQEKQIPINVAGMLPVDTDARVQRLLATDGKDAVGLPMLDVTGTLGVTAKADNGKKQNPRRRGLRLGRRGRR